MYFQKQWRCACFFAIDLTAEPLPGLFLWKALEKDLGRVSWGLSKASLCFFKRFIQYFPSPCSQRKTKIWTKEAEPFWNTSIKHCRQILDGLYKKMSDNPCSKDPVSWCVCLYNCSSCMSLFFNCLSNSQSSVPLKRLQISWFRVRRAVIPTRFSLRLLKHTLSRVS